ncbi:MAG TPA: DUF2273 domain-containing protein [Candidatus Avidehalobacter gallistercoris]|uniref:DUF2273 domain-containing protein n=1 Tax=Candidatus Avidehalobacter gallistercoris TaxID=2840694 RepID=A0A9D1KYX6_9FIRM|nr:DUF2273 domain-containing protein [Candidatus Avidehalobacter gallistercoris]
MNYVDWCKQFYAAHPGVCLGVAGGLLLGLCFAVFGFWRTLVVAVCGAVGLFIGWRLDAGDSPDSWFDQLRQKFNRK